MAQVCGLGTRVCSCLALFCIHYVNWVCVRCPCSDFMDMLQHLINSRNIIIIIMIIIILAKMIY